MIAAPTNRAESPLFSASDPASRDPENHGWRGCFHTQGEEAMHYPANTVASAGQPNTDQRPLDTIQFLADEAERSAHLIADFIGRFRGLGEAGKQGGPTPVPSGHFGQLDRLRNALVVIDSLARELGTIG